jgi:hypothetical protein
LLSPTGRVAEILEDSIYLKEVSREKKIDAEATSQLLMTSELNSGRYQLDVVVRDVKGDRIGTLRRIVDVPAE